MNAIKAPWSQCRTPNVDQPPLALACFSIQWTGGLHAPVPSRIRRCARRRLVGCTGLESVSWYSTKGAEDLSGGQNYEETGRNAMLKPSQVLDNYYLDTRCMLIEIAATLDRYDRAVGQDVND